MNRPLWQILFTLSFAALAVQRAIVGYTLHEGALDPLLAVTWAAVIASALVTAVGVWIERSWAVGALVATGAFLVAGAIAQAWRDVYPLSATIAEVSIVVLLTAGLALALRHGERHPADEPVERRPPRR